MLQVGSVVTYESTTRGPVRAVVVKGPNADGTWDLDVKPQVPLSRIVAQQQHSTAPAPPPAHAAPRASSFTSTPSTLKTQEILHRPSAGSHRPIGTVCFYKSASRGWIPARVTRFCNQSGIYDLDCKTQAPIECIFWIDEGSYVEYYSSSQNKWLPARVLKSGTQPGTFNLDCREAAEIQRMRPRGSMTVQSPTPATLQAMPGMMCYSAEGDAEEPSAIKYETHKTDIRLRPRSKTPDSRRPSKEVIQLEEQVRNDLAGAMRRGTPEAIQAAISRANSVGVSSGPELSHAIHMLHGMGGRLQRTPSADALNGPAPDARSQAVQHIRQGMDASQQQQQHQQNDQVWREGGDNGRQDAPNQQSVNGLSGREGQDNIGQEAPNKNGPGFLTHVLGPKPSENAGLLTRVLGPKPNEESGILERVFGADHGIFKWGKGNLDENDVTNHDMFRPGEISQPQHVADTNRNYNDVPLMTGAVERSEGPPTDPHMYSQNMNKLAAASIESPYKPTGEQARYSAPPTDPQLQHMSGTGSQQNQQHLLAGFSSAQSGRPSSQNSVPPTDPKLVQATVASPHLQKQNFRPEDRSYHGSAPPTDPKLLQYRHGPSGFEPAPPSSQQRSFSLERQASHGSAPPIDPKLQGYGVTHQGGYGSAPPTDPKLQGYGYGAAQQGSHGSAPPTDPKLQGYGVAHQGSRGSAPPTDPKLQGYGAAHQGSPTNPQLQQFSYGGHQLSQTSVGGAPPMYQLPPTSFGGSPPTNPQMGGPRIS